MAYLGDPRDALVEQIRYEERRRYEERLDYERRRMLYGNWEVAAQPIRPIELEEKKACESCGTSHKNTKLDQNGRCKRKQHLSNIHKVASARGTHP